MARTMFTPNPNPNPKIHKRPRSQRGKRMLEDEGAKLFREKEKLALEMLNRDPEKQKRISAEEKRKAQEQCKKVCRELGESALKHFNMTKKDLEYELVCDFKDIVTIEHDRKRFDHINFLGKPKGAAEDEARLFFAEMQRHVTKPPRVICVRLLGPKGIVTGSQGCRTCSAGGQLKDDETIQHPVDGGFTKGLLLPGNRLFF